MSEQIALVRRPGPKLAEGIVTHIDRVVVDLPTAMVQHQAYVAALQANGWRVIEVEPLDEDPDAVFIEDAVVVVGDLAVLTRSGAPQRRGETAGAEDAVRGLGLRVAKIEAPATLDGGDVLQVGNTVYVGRGGRTDQAGIDQFSELLKPLGRTVITVPLREVLHLKSALTALPDGSLIGLPDLIDASDLPAITAATEDEGAHVVPLGGDAVLVSASAPRTIAWLSAQGLRPVAVQISEFEKLEGCVTCLSVLIPAVNPGAATASQS